MFPSDVIDELAATATRLNEVDPYELLGSQAQHELNRLVRVERAVAAKRIALAGRVADSGTWRGGGHRSPQAALGDVCGTTDGEAKKMLGTAEAIAAEPTLGDAFASGELSEDQAAVLAPAVKADPSATEQLVETAKRSSLRDTKAAADKVIVANGDADVRARKAWRSRSVRSSTDAGTGEGRLVVVGPILIIAAMAAAIDVNYSREVPPELRAALRARDGTCAVPGFTSTRGTQGDHDPVGYTDHAPTSLFTLNNKCYPHHHEKTHRGHTLLGEPGDRVWIDANDQVVSSDRADHPPVERLKAQRAAKAEHITGEIRRRRAQQHCEQSKAS